MQRGDEIGIIDDAHEDLLTVQLQAGGDKAVDRSPARGVPEERGDHMQVRPLLAHGRDLRIQPADQRMLQERRGRGQVRQVA